MTCGPQESSHGIFSRVTIDFNTEVDTEDYTLGDGRWVSPIDLPTAFNILQRLARYTAEYIIRNIKVSRGIQKTAADLQSCRQDFSREL